MQREITVLGFFLMVLILIAGCTSSSSGSSAGSTTGNYASGSLMMKTTSPGSSSPQVSPTVCMLPSQDPHRFTKFFPNVPGWKREFGESYTGDKNVRYNPKTICNQHDCGISIADMYDNSDTSNTVRIQVMFEDLGPCVTEEYGGEAQIKNAIEGGPVGSDMIRYQNTSITHNFISNFHGYPAIQEVRKDETTGYMQTVTLKMVIKNSLVIKISDGNTWGQPHSLSDAEANIEKFANAIDFNGLAAAV